MILNRRSKAGFDINTLLLSWTEWEIITTINEWYETKKVERENAILGVKHTHGL
jgi:hypothetical protein